MAEEWVPGPGQGPRAGPQGTAPGPKPLSLVSTDMEADALRYRMLAQHLRAVIFQLDARGHFTVLGASWEELTDLKVASTLGTSLVDALHPVDREPVRGWLRALAAREQEGFRHEVRILTRTGTCWVELFAQASPSLAGEVVGILTDISERRRAQDAVTTRERCLAAVVEVQRRLLMHEPEGYLYQDILAPLGRASGASRAYVFEAHRDVMGRLRVTQRAEWCMAGIAARSQMPGEIALEEELFPEQAALLSAGQPLQFLASETPPRFRAGLARQGILSALLLPVRVNGEVFGFIGFDNCVEAHRWEAVAVSLLAGAAGALSLALEQRSTDALRARAEATLRRTEAGFHLLIEGFPDPVMVHANLHVLYANPAAVRYLGYEGQAGLVGLPLQRLLPLKDQDSLMRHVAEARSGQTSVRASDVTLVRTDGQEVVADIVTLEMTFEGWPALVTIARDFTERKQMQARLMLSDRMASMGTLSAGIAHELNNPLSYVIANLEFVHATLQPEEFDLARVPDWRQALEEARQGAERVRQIVRQLKTFSRVEEERQEQVDLHRVLDSVAQMATSEVKHRARLVKEYGPLPAITGNDGKLFQVFLNLVINAAHAIPEGGVDENEIRLVTVEDARGWAVVEVRDTGGGIAPENLGRIFDPFFTTKPQGVGTGLGLSICLTLVRAHGGDITVESTVGRGTVFRVSLPPSRHEQGTRPEPAVAAVPTRMRVLIVDDEPQVAAALGRLLEDHVVDIAHGGAQGLDLLLLGEQYDVIFCDLLMPELTGMDFHAEVSARLPALAHRFIFMTGGGFTPRAREFLANGAHRVLDKPFDKADVQRLMIEVLSHCR